MANLFQLQTAGSGLSVLIVDDDIASAKALGSLLKRIFERVSVSDSVSDALTRYRKEGGFDIIITDMWMPPSNGFELTQSIKSQKPGQKVIMVSGSREESEIKRVAETAIDAFLSKPLDRSQVYTTLFNIITQVQSEQAGS